MVWQTHRLRRLPAQDLLIRTPVSGDVLAAAGLEPGALRYPAVETATLPLSHTPRSVNGVGMIFKINVRRMERYHGDAARWLDGWPS